MGGAQTSALLPPLGALHVQGFRFSQKLTRWVFNDQPCECADEGHSGTIGRAAKMGWEKIGLPAIVAGRCSRPLYQIWRHGSDFIYAKNSARPGSGFYLHKRFRGLFGKELLRKMTDI